MEHWILTRKAMVRRSLLASMLPPVLPGDPNNILELQTDLWIPIEALARQITVWIETHRMEDSSA